jgi:hypothetical protein
MISKKNYTIANLLWRGTIQSKDSQLTLILKKSKNRHRNSNRHILPSTIRFFSIVNIILVVNQIALSGFI